MKKFNQFVNEIFDFDRNLKVWQSLLLTALVIGCAVVAAICLKVTYIPN